MARSVVIRLFVGGVAAFAAGLVLGAASVRLGLDSGVYILDGTEIVGHRVIPAGLALLALAGAGAVGLVVGTLATVVALVVGLVERLGVGPRS